MNSASPYTKGAIAFHWISALLIVTNFALAWGSEDSPDAERMRLMGIHMSIGITLLILAALWMLWRIRHPRPPFAPTLKRWEVSLARIVHTLFYVLMILIPLAGWAMVSAFAEGTALRWFGLVAVPALPVAKGMASGGFFGQAHELLALGMLVLFLLHVAGALKHHFLDRDETLARMIPWLRRR